jgi:hypothetical protein
MAYRMRHFLLEPAAMFEDLCLEQKVTGHSMEPRSIFRETWSLADMWLEHQPQYPTHNFSLAECYDRTKRLAQRRLCELESQTVQQRVIHGYHSTVLQG